VLLGVGRDYIICAVVAGGMELGFGQSATQFIELSIHLSINQLINQSIDISIYRSINRSAD